MPHSAGRSRQHTAAAGRAASKRACCSKRTQACRVCRAHRGLTAARGAPSAGRLALTVPIPPSHCSGGSSGCPETHQRIRCAGWGEDCVCITVPTAPWHFHGIMNNSLHHASACLMPTLGLEQHKWVYRLRGEQPFHAPPPPDRAFPCSTLQPLPCSAANSGQADWIHVTERVTCGVHTTTAACQICALQRAMGIAGQVTKARKGGGKEVGWRISLQRRSFCRRACWQQQSMR